MAEAASTAELGSEESLTKDERHRRVEAIFIRHPRIREVEDRMEKFRMWSKEAQEPYCLLVLGPSGVGKSTLIADYRARHPRTVTADRTIVPVLTATIPVPATMKTMATELLGALGDPAAEKGTLHQKTWRLFRLLKSCAVELIILDEFQHFIDRDSDKVLRSVADWLKVLIDTARIPVVLTGLHYSRAVLDSNEQLHRRFGTHEALEPFRWDAGGHDSFRRFLGHLDQLLPFPERSGLAGDDMAPRLFAASQGLIASVMKVVRKAAHVAIEANAPCLSLDFLARSYADGILPGGEGAPNPFTTSWSGQLAFERVATMPPRAVGPRLRGTGRTDPVTLTS
ncbi:MAG: TniB family NTP-binding protein [Rhodospirillaceae bacterium]|nr:TniB family NTP-binding protein [Rhodospirillales bacterium]